MNGVRRRTIPASFVSAITDPKYVRFARDAYAAWSEVEAVSGESLVVPTGGLDLYPESALGWIEDYVGSLEKVGGIPLEWLERVPR